MKGTTGITILILFCTVNCFAQLNESDTAKFQMRLSLTGNYQQGNVEVLNIKSKIDYSFSIHRTWVFKSQNSSLYQAFYSKKSDNDIFSRNYLYYKPQNKVYPFAIAYISTNFRRKINSRYFAGAGITIQALNIKKTVLKISASAVYENTNFKATGFNYPEYNGTDKINLWRGTLYAGGWSYILQRRVRLYYDGYWQPAFNNRHNYRAQFDIGADAPLWKGLSFNTLFALTHENVIINNILKNDKMLTFGLAYTFSVK